jgi:hypothetical protein
VWWLPSGNMFRRHGSSIGQAEIDVLRRTVGSSVDELCQLAVQRAQASPGSVVSLEMRTLNGASKLAIGRWPVFKFQPEWSPQHGVAHGKASVPHLTRQCNLALFNTVAAVPDAHHHSWHVRSAHSCARALAGAGSAGHSAARGV